MPMTTSIANIIRDYNSGQVIQELLQNCDDARARHVAFVLDKRKHATQGGLLDEAIRPFTGPALYQYDDAIFLPRDFKSLQNTGDSEKKMDPTSTGKFGLGFNSTYHLTDFPMFISGEVMCLLEPHKRIFRDSENAPASGTQRMMADIVGDGQQLGMMELFDLGFAADELHPGYVPLRNPASGNWFRGVQEAGRSTKLRGEQVAGWPATLFRFPLRTERMRSHSRISQKCGAVAHPPSKVCQRNRCRIFTTKRGRC